MSNQKQDWNKEIKELKDFFKGRELPKGNIELNPGETIVNIDLFVWGHMDFIENNNGNNTFLPYLDRLKKLKNILA